MCGVSIADEARACFIMQYTAFSRCSHAQLAGNEPARMPLAQLLTFSYWSYIRSVLFYYATSIGSSVQIKYYIYCAI